jgi:ABC-type lipoprotein export system ATPase subunit
MTQQPGAPTGRRIETELRRGAEPIGTFREALVRFRHVFKIYRVADTGVVALGGVDFDVGEGEFLAVVGPSGSGKSTILNMIGGLDRASAGTVEVEGRDLGRLDEDELTAYRRDRVGFVWQGTARNLVPYLNVVENVRLPSTASGRHASCSRSWGSPTARTTGRASSRAGNSSASRSPSRCRTCR